MNAIVLNRSVLIATTLFAACSTAPATPAESAAQNASTAAVVEFLVSSAASDFHDHPVPGPGRFRDVRVAHLTAAAGEKRYLLCGQVLTTRQDGSLQWTPFATIKTSGYEQWIGTSAATYCNDASITFDSVQDLSSVLQSRLSAMR